MPETPLRSAGIPGNAGGPLECWDPRECRRPPSGAPGSPAMPEAILQSAGIPGNARGPPPEHRDPRECWRTPPECWDARECRRTPPEHRDPRECWSPPTWSARFPGNTEVPPECQVPRECQSPPWNTRISGSAGVSPPGVPGSLGMLESPLWSTGILENAGFPPECQIPQQCPVKCWDPWECWSPSPPEHWDLWECWRVPPRPPVSLGILESFQSARSPGNARVPSGTPGSPGVPEPPSPRIMGSWEVPASLCPPRERRDDGARRQRARLSLQAHFPGLLQVRPLRAVLHEQRRRRRLLLLHLPPLLVGVQRAQQAQAGAPSAALPGRGDLQRPVPDGVRVARGQLQGRRVRLQVSVGNVAEGTSRWGRRGGDVPVGPSRQGCSRGAVAVVPSRWGRPVGPSQRGCRGGAVVAGPSWWGRPHGAVAAGPSWRGCRGGAIAAGKSPWGRRGGDVPVGPSRGDVAAGGRHSGEVPVGPSWRGLRGRDVVAGTSPWGCCGGDVPVGSSWRGRPVGLSRRGHRGGAVAAGPSWQGHPVGPCRGAVPWGRRIGPSRRGRRGGAVPWGRRIGPSRRGRRGGAVTAGTSPWGCRGGAVAAGTSRGAVAVGPCRGAVPCGRGARPTPCPACSTRSASAPLLNMLLLSDENHRDIYVSAVAGPPGAPCARCRAHGAARPPCLRHGFLLHTKYQVVYPFPTFQPAFQLKKDHVVLLNTSYSLVACAVVVRAAGDGGASQILYGHRNQSWRRAGAGNAPERPPSAPSERDGGARPGAAPPAPTPGTPAPGDSESGPGRATGLSPAVAKAKEFVADIFRRAKEAKGSALDEDEDDEEEEEGSGSGFGGRPGAGSSAAPPVPAGTPPACEGRRGRPPAGPASPRGGGGGAEAELSPKASPGGAEPGYVNYTRLRYVLEPGEPGEPADGEDGASARFEDDKISLPFVVTDLHGRSLKPLKDRAVAQGQFLTVEQLTLDFEYVINEVIRHDAAWARQFCSFSDYDIVILEVCPETNQVIINIGLLLLAFPSPDEEGQLRPKTYHTSLKVAWDLNTGTFVTVSVGDLTEVKGQTSGSVWSSYRKGCVDTVMKWLVPEGSGRYVNRMTNEALHKGCSLKVLADNERYTWIVL